MKFIYQKKFALTEEKCKSIIDYFDSHEDNHRSGKQLGYGGNKVSTDWSKSFYHEDEIDCIVGPVVAEGMKDYIKLHPGISRVDAEWDTDYRYNVQKYKPGEGFMNWHCEHSGCSSDAMTRILAWMIYLNDVPDGGTEFLNQETTIKAEVGKLCIWPAYFTHVHRSQVSHTKTKYIATGWAKFV